MNDPQQVNRRDQRREAILKVAGEVFFEEGYSAASMSTIAARLGGSKGTLYNYFKSKEELFSAHIEEACRVIAEDAFNLYQADDLPVEAVLTRIGESFLGHIYSDWSVNNFRLIVTEAKRAPELAQIFYDAGPAVGRDRLAAYLEGAERRGAIAVDDCRLASAQFLSLCRNDDHFKLTLNLIPTPSAEDIRRHVAQAVRLFMAAYGVAGSSEGGVSA